MNFLAFVQFRMKGGNELVTLAGSHNLAIYFSQNLSISPHLFNIRSTDESHWDVALDALHRSLNVETAQLATVGISQSRDVHRSNALARLALYLLGKKNQALPVCQFMVLVPA